MEVEVSDRGFERIRVQRYTSPFTAIRLVGQSSAIGPYSDSYERPGASFLWIGDDHHLNREQVSELVSHLSAWLETGSLSLPAPQTAPKS